MDWNDLTPEQQEFFKSCLMSQVEQTEIEQMRKYGFMFLRIVAFCFVVWGIYNYLTN